MVPVKSAHHFCPATKHYELFFLAADELKVSEARPLPERNALTGRHTRLTVVEFGATWETLVRDADSSYSSNTTVGLGRSFAWNQWARVNNAVDAAFKVIRADRERFLTTADALHEDCNALDARSWGAPLVRMRSPAPHSAPNRTGARLMPDLLFARTSFASQDSSEK